VEERAVKDAARQASGREAYVIPEPLAAAIGAGMPIDTPTGNMVVDIGGGTSEAAVVAMYGIVVSSSARVGGVRFDEAIASFVRRKYNLMIGEQTAEEVKLEIGSALPLEETLEMEVKGRDQVAGLPRTINITSDEVTEALAEPLSSVVGVVKGVLEQTPPELASDIIDRGMVLTGGGALLRNVDRMLTACRAMWPRILWPAWPWGLGGLLTSTTPSVGAWWLSDTFESETETALSRRDRADATRAVFLVP
jgi:rod shape-determining protein MreB